MKKLLKICVLLLVLLALLLLYGCEQDENSGQSALDQASNESDSKEENSSLDDSTPEEILTVIQHLVAIGCLVRRDNPQPRLCLSAGAKPILFQGKTVSIRRTDARLPKGEYFDQELEGCAVVDDATGEELGKLDRVLLYPAHKVYQVRGGGHEYLIPAVPGVFIASIDPEAEIIRVHMMKGLATDEN